MSYSPPAAGHLHFDFTAPFILLSFNFTSSAYTPPASPALNFNLTIVLIPLHFEFAPERCPGLTKALLLSLGIRFRGQICKKWICQMSHGTQQIRAYSIPSDPKTPPQLSIRAKFAAGVLSWQNLSQSAKLYWRRVGVRKKRPITSINAFISAWMRDKIT